MAVTDRAGSPLGIASTRGPARIASLLLNEHHPALSIALHLLPGVLTGAVYLLLRQPVIAHGYPSLVALNLAIPIALIPSTLGPLMYLGYKRNGRLSLRGVVNYHNPLQLSRWLVYVPLTFGACLALVIVLDKVVSPALQTTLFGWMPVVDWGLGGGYSRAVLIGSYALVAVFSSLAEPIVEEVYFRGFLLPRMRYSGRGTTLLHSFLYALYHLWYPWRLVTLTISMTPLVFSVRRTKNFYVGMIVHTLLDSFYLIFGIAFILGMR